MAGQKRGLVFAHDGRSLGHLRRLSRLAEQLQGPASVLFVTGHRDAFYIVPQSCEYVHLPSAAGAERSSAIRTTPSPVSFCVVLSACAPHAPG